MAVMIRKATEQVFRDRNPVFLLSGIPSIVVGCTIIFFALSKITENKSRHMEIHDPTSIFFLFFIAVPILAIGVCLVLYWVNNKIEINDKEIWAQNALGMVSFRSRWDQILSVTETVASNGIPKTHVASSTGVLKLDNRRADLAMLLTEIRNRSGKGLPVPNSQPFGVPQTVSNTTQPSRGLRVFRIRYAWYAVARMLPFAAFGLALPMRFHSTERLLTAWPLFAICFGIPLVTASVALVLYANAKVIMEPDRLKIVNGFGQLTFDAKWSEISSVVLEWNGPTQDPSRYKRRMNYRIEAGTRKGKITTAIRFFDECLNEIKARVPSSTTFVG